MAVDTRVEGEGSFGATPLACAVRSRQLKAARKLIGAGAAVNARQVGQMTPLMIAADMCSLELVNALLGAGAKRGARDDTGTTTYDYADRCERPVSDRKKVMKRLALPGA